MKKKLIFSIVGIIILVICASCLIHVVRNKVILDKLNTEAIKQVDVDNYHVEEYTYSGVGYAKKDIFVMGERKFCKLQNFNSDNTKVIVMIMYYDGENNQTFVESRNGDEVTKSYVTSEGPLWTGDPVETYKFHGDDRVWGIKQEFFSRIKEGKINGIECYKIDYGENFSDLNKFDLESVYRDKKTGLPVRACSGNLLVNETKSFAGCSDYMYEFGTVTEKDFELPDVSEYKLIENE